MTLYTEQYPGTNDIEIPMIHYIVQYQDTDDRETPMIHYTVQYPDTDDRETPSSIIQCNILIKMTVIPP